MKNYHSKQGSQGGKKWAGLLTCQTILLVLIGLFVSISTNLAAAESLSNVTQPRETPEEELAALKLDMSTVLLRYSRLRDNYTSLAKNCSATVVNFTGCPQGWLHVLVNEKCYYFSNDKMDWPSSRDNCTSMGAHLSILHSMSAHEALEKEASRIDGFINYFWIGLSDREMEGDWRWVDNTTLTNNFWQPFSLEPDNNVSGGKEGEDCVVLQSNTHAWSDVPCEFIYRRICQMDAFPITSP
ncbi:C-type lectin domain family 4 member E [Oncorhynchus kisutch]|uniref:C-type lectin domain family 4 member E n=1 Tax=Oncorhynchus kisutch TaxID=8019 RepID=A0A8C7D7G8_ONCKI|nr:C-type lectin domain family 4 member E [Oncorhynchus kisutch]